MKYIIITHVQRETSCFDNTEISPLTHMVVYPMRYFCLLYKCSNLPQTLIRGGHSCPEVKEFEEPLSSGNSTPAYQRLFYYPAADAWAKQSQPQTQHSRCPDWNNHNCNLK